MATKTFRRIHSRWILLTGLAVAGALAMHGCMTLPTPSQKATKEPRSGRVLVPTSLPGEVAIVYSYKSEINLGGLEKMHPGDAHRQGRIFNALVSDQAIAASDVFVPEPATDEQLLAVHDRAYLESLAKSGNVARALEASAIGLLPDTSARDNVVMPFRYQTGGTVLAAELAIKHGLAINLGGGFQHAFRDHGEGFCLFADVPLAIHALREKKLARRAMIVDLDIHHENGFASYYVNDRDVCILDIFERDNYPAVKVWESNPLPIEYGISEEAYLALLHRELPKVMDAFRPEVLFYVAGVDPLESDALGHAHISLGGMVQRDLYVIRQARQRGIPTVMVLAGGYSPQGWRVTYRTISVLLTGRDPDASPPSTGKPVPATN